MLGTRIPHPASTRYNSEAEGGKDKSRPRKRPKRENSGGDHSASDFASDTEERATSPPTFSRRIPDEIPDSEDEEYSDADDVHEQRVTELESALPPVATDKAAIADYEANRVAELSAADGGKEQSTYKSSIYVDAFNLALSTTLEEEKYLFDNAELEIFNYWKELGYEAQYLYVRLFLRKTSAWHRFSRIGYHSDIADLPAAIDELQVHRKLPAKIEETQKKPFLFDSEEVKLSESFSFADSSEPSIKTLEEASSLLSLDELKALAKDAKVQGKNKSDLLKSFRRMSSRQTSLGWGTLKRSDSERSIVSDTSEKELKDRSPPNSTAGILSLERSDSLVSVSSSIGIDNLKGELNRDEHFVRKIMAITGPFIRLSIAPLKLFERVHLVFYRSTEWTEKSLTTIILAKISRKNFPNYIVSRSANIFSSRDALLEFEAALRMQFRVDNILEFNGAPGKDGLQEVVDLFDSIYPRWKILLAEEQVREDSIYQTGEGAYLRRFSPAWVYTRIIHKAAYVFGKLRMHEREYDLLTELLNQSLFHLSRRGSWYQRKALLEEHYLYAIRPFATIRDSEMQKRYWKRVSLKTCELGLQDRDCHVMFHYDLQKRIKKLEKGLKIARREQHDFGHVRLAEPEERNIEGIRIEVDYTGHVSRRRSRRHEERGRSTRTIWLDPQKTAGDGGEECTVEEMCLSGYRAMGFKGYHSEGGIMRTLFAYLFYDILFLYVPNVFQTAFQTCPLDLHTDAFYPARVSEVNARLAEIGNGGAAGLVRAVGAREGAAQTCVVGLRWEFAAADLLEIAECFDGAALATVCRVMAQEYGQRGGGMPDLFLWRPETREVRFAEVKSENDRLSDTQRLWIHVLTGAGVKVELCNAVAREVRIRKAA